MLRGVGLVFLRHSVCDRNIGMDSLPPVRETWSEEGKERLPVRVDINRVCSIPIFVAARHETLDHRPTGHRAAFDSILEDRLPQLFFIRDPGARVGNLHAVHDDVVSLFGFTHSHHLTVDACGRTVQAGRCLVAAATLERE